MTGNLCIACTARQQEHGLQQEYAHSGGLIESFSQQVFFGKHEAGQQKTGSCNG